VDCCYPDESFWIQVGQLGRNGEQLYTPGVPVTIRYSPHCATTRPDVTLTYDEIIALDPDADFVFYLAGQGPEVVPAGCEDPVCAPCPRCCVVKHIPSGECGGPACCEHGGSFRVGVVITATYQEFKRVYGWRGDGQIFCGECLVWSGEAQSANATATTGLNIDFECQGDGTYRVTCVAGLRRQVTNEYGVDGPSNGYPCEGPPNGFPPIQTLLANVSVTESCPDFPGLLNTSLFGMSRRDVVNLLLDWGPTTGLRAALTDSVFQNCAGLAGESIPIDRSWSADPCELALNEIGTAEVTSRTWSGGTSCDGGTFNYTGTYANGTTTRFHPGPGVWIPFVSSARLDYSAEWTVERTGQPTCIEPQCIGNPGGLPPLLFDRRSAVPAVRQGEARAGCRNCGKDGGL
jgi:hypothetical protein